jgi:hypothetical protein
LIHVTHVHARKCKLQDLFERVRVSRVNQETEEANYKNWLADREEERKAVLAREAEARKLYEQRIEDACRAADQKRILEKNRADLQAKAHAEEKRLEAERSQISGKVNDLLTERGRLTADCVRLANQRKGEAKRLENDREIAARVSAQLMVELREIEAKAKEAERLQADSDAKVLEYERLLLELEAQALEAQQLLKDK